MNIQKECYFSIYNQKKAKLEEQETEKGCTQKKVMMPIQFLGAKQISQILPESVE